MDEQKKQALKVALGQIEKQFGKGSVMFLGDEEARTDIEAVSTGSLSLDIALGIGGLPRGRVVEIYGPESSGKTTMTLHVIAEMQKLGGTAAFIDAEHALDPAYARALGVDIDNLDMSKVDKTMFGAGLSGENNPLEGEEEEEVCRRMSLSNVI